MSDTPTPPIATADTTPAPEPATPPQENGKKPCGSPCGGDAAAQEGTPKAKRTPPPILFSWLGFYWIGMPAPVRWWNPERWGKESGCGCMLRLKQAWIAFRDFWRPMPHPSRIVTTPYGTHIRPMSRRELEAAIDKGGPLTRKVDPPQKVEPKSAEATPASQTTPAPAAAS